MRKIFFGVLSLSLVLIFNPLVVKAENLKIGVVDFQRALNEVNEGKTAKARLKAEFEEKQRSLTAKQNELNTLKDNLQKQATALSKEALQQKEKEYRDKFVELQKTLGQFQKEMATKEGEITKNIIVKLKQVTSEIGKNENFTMIFERSQDTLVYAPAAEDVTSKVIAKFNGR